MIDIDTLIDIQVILDADMEQRQGQLINEAQLVQMNPVCADAELIDTSNNLVNLGADMEQGQDRNNAVANAPFEDEVPLAERPNDLFSGRLFYEENVRIEKKLIDPERYPDFLLIFSKRIVSSPVLVVQRFQNV